MPSEEGWDPLAVLRASVHDLKGPAARIALLADLLGREVQAGTAGANERVRALAENTARSSRELQATIEGIRRFGAQLSGAYSPEPVDLRAVAKEAVARFEGELRTAEGRISIGELPVVQADAEQMRFVFEELFRNALRFRLGAAPFIDISAGRVDSAENSGMWEITVANNGRDIDPEFAARIPVPFRRGSGGGAGMGLVTCAAVLHRMGGGIRLVPGETGGAKVLLTIRGE